MRFVSTPEVLERFVTLEKEIAQIQKSIESNEGQKNDLAMEGMRHLKKCLHYLTCELGFLNTVRKAVDPPQYQIFLLLKESR